MSIRYILNWDGTDTYLAISDTTNKLVGLVPQSFVDASYDPRNLPALASGPMIQALSWCNPSIELAWDGSPLKDELFGVKLPYV